MNLTTKTGPLVEAALLNYEPTPKDLMLELREQNKVLNSLREDTSELSNRVGIQNGRIVKTEALLAPINALYQKIIWVLTIGAFAGPLVVAVISKLVAHLF